MEAFVLSRVDGRTSDADIALLTGMSNADAILALQRLAELGAVVYDTAGPTTAAPQSSPRISPRPEGAVSGLRARVEPVITEMARPSEGAPAPSYDPAELEEPADLDAERKRRILDVFYALETLDHYALLKVEPTADKKVVKAAYYDVVAIFHPDKYFGKDLGSFRSKLEKIFARITEAHDTLTRNKTREEYDRYLESRRATRALDTSTDVDAIRREMEQEARLAATIERPSTLPAGRAPSEAAPGPRATPSSVFASPATPSAPPVSVRPLSPDERRRALARKFGASAPPPPRPSQDKMPAVQASAAHEAAADQLKRRYEARLAQVRDERVKRYVDQAEQALSQKQVVAAANAMRIAGSLAPDDTALAERFAVIERQANAALADQYVEQAKYDERRGHFLEAARTYERALRGRPSAQLYDRTAYCLMEAREDLRRAGELARKAVELAPTEIAYRITLARVYARAGMEQSALGELERARAESPNDDTIKDWIKRVKRGEI
jgi:curved DNA-binding protein CbpA